MFFSTEKKQRANRDLIEQILVEKYNQYYRLAYSYVHNEADACDIVQNGAYKALRASHTLKNPEYAQTWVYRIMLNECFGYLKNPRYLSYEAVWEESGQEACPVEDRYADVDLRRALDTLADSDKAVIILKYFEDMKLEEIAEILEENINTVKSRLYRSLKKLRGILADGAERSEKLGKESVAQVSSEI